MNHPIRGQSSLHGQHLDQLQLNDGPAPIDNFSTTLGDGVDGYAREQVVRPVK